MPRQTNNRNHILKLVSADKLVMYKPLEGDTLPDTVRNQFVTPLRPYAQAGSATLGETVPITTRVYRLWDRQFDSRHHVFIAEYREVL